MRVVHVTAASTSRYSRTEMGAVGIISSALACTFDMALRHAIKDFFKLKSAVIIEFKLKDPSAGDRKAQFD